MGWGTSIMNHKVTISTTTYEDIILSEDQMIEITIEVLRKRFEIPYRPSIENGKLVSHYEQCGGSHCWDTSDVVRKASKQDIFLINIIDQLRK
jgi:hypothetical protein